MRNSLLSFALILVTCQMPSEPAPDRPGDAAALSELTMIKQDLQFLRSHGDIQILESASGGCVVASAQYQGRVLTSAVSSEGPSLGWINRSFIEAGRTGTQFDNYGGANRFWLGPEAGPYGFYFPPGADFQLNHWQVPSSLQEGAWKIAAQTSRNVIFRTSLDLTNYSGTRFLVDVERQTRVLERTEAEEIFDISLAGDLRWVAFESVNRITNAGKQKWEKESGLLSIWILGLFKPVGTSWVVIPYKGSPGEQIVNDGYFGSVPQDRLAIREGYVLYKADGKWRSKIGIGPKHALPVMGSYNDTMQLLTLVHFTLDRQATDYVNSMWEEQIHPYRGDVVNSYNDGPTRPGTETMGGFYELESSSPALALSPGESYTHHHRTLHLMGRREWLDPIADQALGVSASEIAQGITD